MPEKANSRIQAQKVSGGSCEENLTVVKENRGEEEKQQKRSGLAQAILKDVGISLAIALGILVFIQPTIVNQTSMYPTCYPGDYILIERQAYLFSSPKRGDIIVFKSNLEDENGAKKLLIKRIIGISGDHVVIENGSVQVNGKTLKENYLVDGTYTEGTIDCTVPEDAYFVMGDNRDVSIDSRSQDVGFVNKDDIVGKSALRIFPLNRAGKVE